MIEIKNLCFSFYSQQIFSNLNLKFMENETTCILGGSAIGKTTLLNLIAGLLTPSSGEISGVESVSYIFQQPRLIEQKTVFKNLDLALKSAIKDKNEREEKILGFLREVGIENEKDKYPNQISGGTAQRIALCRAFLFPAKLLLLDEPFKELDIKTKQDMENLFLALNERQKHTAIFVTHSITQAIKLADKIMVFSKNPSLSVSCLDNKGNADKSMLAQQIEELLYKG